MRNLNGLRRSALSVFLLTLFLITAGAGLKKGGPAPYGIDKRPMPSGEDLEALAPPAVGPFKRPAFPKGTKLPSDEDLNVTYEAGKDSVFFGFSRPGTPEDAQAGVEMSREEAVASKIDLRGEQVSLGTDPSWHKTAKFMAWSRGPYFFYADASSPEALDRFLKAFPY